MSSSPVASASGPADLRQRFRRLVSEWKERSHYLSNTAQMAMLKPYQRIIGMGWPVVPLLLKSCSASRTSGFGRGRRSRGRIQCRPRRQASSVAIHGR